MMKEKAIVAESFMHLQKIFYILQAPVSIQKCKNMFEKLTIVPVIKS